MQTSNRLFDDIARMASGAMHLAGGMREEVETRVRERLERLAGEMNLVTREEFDAVQAMASKAREEQEILAETVARLEREIQALKTPVEEPKAQAGRGRKRAAAKASPEEDAADAAAGALDEKPSEAGLP